MPGMTVSPAEVARFDALAARWWDPNGPMRPLHRMNPARVAWIAERIGAAGAPPPNPLPQGEGEHSLHSPASPHRLRLLDVGCGAGLAAEALARRGFDVLGLDAAGAGDRGGPRPCRRPEPVRSAYRTGVAEDLLAEGARFPVITALEVIEHVPDPAAFLATLARTAGAWRQAVPLHAQPHTAVIPCRQGGRRISAALAAGRHA